MIETSALAKMVAELLIVIQAFTSYELPEVPPRVEYSATAMARDLDGFFKAMHGWGTRHLRPRGARGRRRAA